jgi:hypothetical protein
MAAITLGVAGVIVEPCGKCEALILIIFNAWAKQILCLNKLSKR